MSSDNMAGFYLAHTRAFSIYICTCAQVKPSKEQEVKKPHHHCPHAMGFVSFASGFFRDLKHEIAAL